MHYTSIPPHGNSSPHDVPLFPSLAQACHVDRDYYFHDDVWLSSFLQDVAGVAVCPVTVGVVGAVVVSGGGGGGGGGGLGGGNGLGVASGAHPHERGNLTAAKGGSLLHRHANSPQHANSPHANLVGNLTGRAGAGRVRAPPQFVGPVHGARETWATALRRLGGNATRRALNVRLGGKRELLRRLATERGLVVRDAGGGGPQLPACH